MHHQQRDREDRGQPTLKPVDLRQENIKQSLLVRQKVAVKRL